VDRAYGFPVAKASEEEVAMLAQAMGMVSVQADCTLDEALTLINERAWVSRHTVYEVAAAVVDRAIRFG
jgi:AmiR/NasT family two-component response regulator